VVDICAPTNGRPVEGSIGVLDQRRWECAIRLVEAVQRGQRAGCRDSEDRPTATGEGGAIPAPARCPVEVSIVGLDQSCDGIGAVRVVEVVRSPPSSSTQQRVETVSFCGTQRSPFCGGRLRLRALHSWTHGRLRVWQSARQGCGIRFQRQTTN
jgi:hypothetical protein